MEDKKKPEDLILNPIDGTAVWTLREEGDTLGQTYSGKFIFKCYLTPTDILSIGRLYRDLIGHDYGHLNIKDGELIVERDSSDQERYLAFAISQLSKRIVKAPPFWSTQSLVNGDIPDINILLMALDRAITSEQLYKEDLAKKKEEALARAETATKAMQDRLKAKDKDEL